MPVFVIRILIAVGSFVAAQYFLTTGPSPMRPKNVREKKFLKDKEEEKK